MVKFFSIVLSALMAVCMVSCIETIPAVEVPFHVHKSCAYRGKPEKLVKMVISSEAEFNEKFMYTVAGPDSIDPVDFGSSFAVAICDVVSNEYRNIEIKGVQQKNALLYVLYTIESLGEVSYTRGASVVASISRDYQGLEIAFIDITGME